MMSDMDNIRFQGTISLDEEALKWVEQYVGPEDFTQMGEDINGIVGDGARLVLSEYITKLIDDGGCIYVRLVDQFLTARKESWACEYIAAVSFAELMEDGALMDLEVLVCSPDGAEEMLRTLGINYFQIQPLGNKPGLDQIVQ